MSTTLHLLSLNEKNLSLYLAAQEADTTYWNLIMSDEFKAGALEGYSAAEESHKLTSDAWYEARVALERGEQLPVLEASHRDTEVCELTALFEAGENFTVLVTDENLQELADAWEDSNRKRTFTLGRGKGTVVAWLMEHRGRRITLAS